MFRPLASLILGTAGLMLLANPVSAQVDDVARPVSRIGGNAGRELQSIYRNSIGQGFSARSLTSLDLRRSMAVVPNVGQLSTGAGPVGSGLNIYSPYASKPFSGYNPSPTVSPWLNLFREDFGGNSDLNYQTLVRPQLQQQQFNQQMQREAYESSRRLQSLAASSAYNIQGSTTQPPTGHQSAFMYYGRYYRMPTVGRR